MAMLDLTSFAPALKQLYPKGLSEILYKKCPAYGLINKTRDFYGELWVIAPFFAGTMGSNTFVDAQGNKENISLDKFQVKRKRQYSVASVDAETIMASANDKGAFARALDKQIRGAMYTIERGLAHQIYGNAGGARGKGNGSWTVSGDTVTLSDKRDIVHFEKNLVLQFSATDGTSGSVKTGSVKVKSVDRNAGSFKTVEANISASVPTVANGDYIFRKGDFGNSINGFRAWVPDVDPTSTLFNGVDRTQDLTRLGGVRIKGGGKLMEEVVFDTIAEISINGGQSDLMLINSRRFADLVKSIYSKTWVTVETDIPGIGYKALEFPSEHGTVAVIPDPNCPYAFSWVIEKDSWEFKSLGEYPHFATDDGKKYQREATSDGIEFRVRGFGDMGCHAPGHNGIIDWDTA